MKHGLTTNPSLDTSECLVVGVFSNENQPACVASQDKQQGELITHIAKKLKEKNDSVWHMELNGHSLLIFHCGDKAEFTHERLSQNMADITTMLLKQRVTSATICMPQLPEHTPDWQLQHMLLQLESNCYQFLPFKSVNKKPFSLQSVVWYLPEASLHVLKEASAIAEGVQLTRTLADLPANVCTPRYLSQEALALAKNHDSLTVKIMGKEELTEMGMGALLAVGQGSIEPPQLIEVQYKGSDDATPPIVLIGKGITFDSGGLSLKPADFMNEMKYDMAGAASVLGTLKACALLKLPIHVIGLLASAENMPSGSAVKPGDIVTSLSGQTIEIVNTDAEGRLVLADALTYAERFNPRFVVDIATLTGAIIIALGNVTSGFMANDEALAERIEVAAKKSADKAWRLPLDEAYQAALDSPIADMVNATFDRIAGSITAGCFLSRYAKKFPWAHLDIAGTAWVSGKARRATGRPVPLLIELIRHASATR